MQAADCSMCVKITWICWYKADSESRLRWGVRFAVSKKIVGDDNNAGPRTTFWGPSPLRSNPPQALLCDFYFGRISKLQKNFKGIHYQHPLSLLMVNCDHGAEAVFLRFLPCQVTLFALFPSTLPFVRLSFSFQLIL